MTKVRKIWEKLMSIKKALELFNSEMAVALDICTLKSQAKDEKPSRPRPNKRQFENSF